ncbi:hypothetical protein ACU4GG_41210 [Streptomyces nojiriensis]
MTVRHLHEVAVDVRRDGSEDQALELIRLQRLRLGCPMSKP